MTGSAAASTDQPCSECTTVGRRGYCAPGRCYCGHPACHAFASWTPMPDLRGTAAPTSTPRRRSTSWDDREESTWIDQM